MEAKPNLLCEGKVAIVTGAAGCGMARSIALTLGREGASVVVNYRRSEANAQAIVDYMRGRLFRRLGTIQPGS